MITDLPTSDNSLHAGILAVAKAAARHVEKPDTAQPPRATMSVNITGASGDYGPHYAITDPSAFENIIASLRRQSQAEADLARWIEAMTEDSEGGAGPKP